MCRLQSAMEAFNTKEGLIVTWDDKDNLDQSESHFVTSARADKLL